MGPISAKILVDRLHFFFPFKILESQRENMYSYNCLLYGVDPCHGRISVKKYTLLFPVSSEHVWEGGAQ